MSDPAPETTDDDPATRLSRRRFLRRTGFAGAAVAVPLVAGYAGYRLPRPEQTAAAADQPGAAQVHRFVSRPDLSPPRLTVVNGDVPAAEPRYLFLAPRGYMEDGNGQAGCLIVDRRGQPVWFLPRIGDDKLPADFKVQTYRGEPVITWWQGSIDEGNGKGFGVIYDRGYRKVAEVRAAGDLEADLHEFLLTDAGTALLLAYPVVRTDLSAIGGGTDDWVHDGVVQEVDVETGELVSEWRALNHISIDETYQEIGDRGTMKKPHDYFHINSVTLAPDGDLIVSARNTWGIYKISRETGEIGWRLGGKRSDFTLGDRARFAWQHDAVLHPGGRLALFDNGAGSPEQPRSRGLVLQLDHDRGHAAVRNEYHHPAGLHAPNQGSMQVLPSGRALVGWGAQPYTSEFTEAGDLVFDARFPAPDQSYRARSGEWTGAPDERPAIAIGPNRAGGHTVFVSWNGSTEVDRWQILAGGGPGALEPVATVRRAGFETAVTVRAKGPFFAAAGLDQQGRELGRSEPTRGS